MGETPAVHTSVRVVTISATYGAGGSVLAPRLAEKLGLKKMRLGMKHLRKTAATLLGQHPQYKFYANHFLADSPKGMADRHYVTPSDEEFFLALDWLRGQIFPKGGKLAAKKLLDQQAQHQPANVLSA